MVLWIFGYGSLMWRAGFSYDSRQIGYIKDYKRVFYQGSTEHRGTPEKPGRAVTLQHLPGGITWGAAYRIDGGADGEKAAMDHLEVRERAYDVRAYASFFTTDAGNEPVATHVLVFIASEDKTKNRNYLGPAPLDVIARQIATCVGPSGPNWEYLYEIESHLREIGVPDEELFELALRVRAIRRALGSL